MRRIALGLALIAAVAGCSSGTRTGSRSAASTTRPAATVARGATVGWHPMAYLATNRPYVTMEIQTRAAAGLVVGRPNTFHVNPYPLGRPVWVSIAATRRRVHARDGQGWTIVSTDGCPATAACDRRPLYAPSAFPIPTAPPGGVVVRDGFALHLDTAAVQPGRYDFTLPIRYPSSASNPAVLDMRDLLHVRFDVYATPPPSATCTPADLHRPPAAIPPPHTLTDTGVVQNQTRLDPPPLGFRTHVSAARARQQLTPVAGGGGEATFVLAAVSEAMPASPQPDGSFRPLTYDVVAWVLYTQRVAVNANSISPPGPPAGGATVPRDACFFGDGISGINATTGKPMDSGGGTAALDPIHF